MGFMQSMGCFLTCRLVLTGSTCSVSCGTTLTMLVRALQNGAASDVSELDEGQAEPEEDTGPQENVVTVVPRDVYVVDTLPKAQAALERLQAIHAANPDTIFACDTEVWLFGCSRKLGSSCVRDAELYFCLPRNS